MPILNQLFFFAFRLFRAYLTCYIQKFLIGNNRSFNNCGLALSLSDSVIGFRHDDYHPMKLLGVCNRIIKRAVHALSVILQEFH